MFPTRNDGGKQVMATVAGQTAYKRKAWPKAHLVYFLLAAFDLLAVAGGLYLSHQVIRVFQDTVETNAKWDERLASAWGLVDTASDANAAVIGAFEAASPRHAHAQFDSKAYEFRREVQAFLDDVKGRFPGASAKRAHSILVKLDLLMADIEKDADRVFDRLEAGDREGAVKALSAMQRRYTNLRFQIKDLNRLVGMVKVGKAESNQKWIASLRGYEYAIGGMIALMVCCIAVYGHWIGGLMRRKYEEAQAAQEQAEDYARELAAVNDSIIGLNVELSENMRKLKDAQEEIVRRGRLAQLGQLTATVAHELRNPMSAIRTSAFLLERKTRDKGLGLEPQLDRISGGIARCDGIITQLLDFARSQALHRESVTVDEWLKKLIQDEAEKLPKAVSVRCELGLSDLSAAIDSARMSRVLINLLSNASEAMVGRGDDPAKFSTKDPTIVVETRRATRGIEIIVADNGPGIAPENLQKIREPLYTTKSFGTGLGLPAAEKVVEQHGGGLEVESTLGQGARFTVWLPVEPAFMKAA